MSDILNAMLSSQADQAPANAEAAPQQAESSQPQANSVNSEFLERFNRLASKEAGLRKKEQEMRAERETWKEKIDRYERLERLKAEDPEAALQELGLSYDTLTERRLKGFGSEEQKVVSNLQKELQELKQQLQQKSQNEEQERVQSALQNANAQVRQICAADEFELIQANDAYDLVLETAAEFFQATGKMVPLDQAAKHVEQHLETKLERILAAKKVASRFNKSPEQSQELKVQSNAQESATLSSSLAGSTKPQSLMTEDDLRQAAMRALRGG